MTSRQCQARLKDDLRTHPVPDVGPLSRAALKTCTPLDEFILLAAWRTGKTIIRCDDALLSALRSELSRQFWRAELFYLCAENTD